MLSTPDRIIKFDTLKVTSPDTTVSSIEPSSTDDFGKKTNRTSILTSVSLLSNTYVYSNYVFHSFKLCLILASIHKGCSNIPAGNR